MQVNKNEATYPITVSEAYHLLSPLRERYTNTQSASYEIYKNTFEYTDKFGRIKDRNKVEHLRSALVGFGFTGEEISSLASLLPQTTDEAKTIVPSINRMDDAIIESAIRHIQDL